MNALLAAAFPAALPGFGAVLSVLAGAVPTLPTERLIVPSAFDAWMALPQVKSLLPIPILLAIAPVVYWFFKGTWRELDAEATVYRAKLTAEGRFDTRPLVCLAIMAVVLTMQEYYGGRVLYDRLVRPWLVEQTAAGSTWIQLSRYDELYGYAWWVWARVVGYVLIPFPVWKLLYPHDSLLDLGLRVRGFLKHVWIYGLCLAVVVPAMLLVATQPDFGTYYPFYKLSSRSWSDFWAWELMYYLQFLALELFFRGFIVGTLRRSLGSAAIFAMAVPYCMIHYGKPYLEANGAIVAGVVLGSLAARTRSIYAGFLVHITVAFLMDFLALWHRGALPTVWWPT
jgi:membrane protease YdiL (CAAX protease family)